MNHTYRVVYHPASNTYIAVSEMTTQKHKSSKAIVASAAVAALGLAQQAQAVVTVSNTQSKGVILSGVSSTYMEAGAVPSLSVKQRIASNKQPIHSNTFHVNAADSTQSKPFTTTTATNTVNVDEEIISTVRVNTPAQDDVNVRTTAATAAADNLPKEPTPSKRATSGSLNDEILSDNDNTQSNHATAQANGTRSALRASLDSKAKALAAQANTPSTTGVNINVNGNNVVLENGSTLNLVNGRGTVVSVDNTTSSPTVKINTPLSYADQAGNATETPSNAVALVGANAHKPVTIHNVEAGIATHDAVNVGQLRQTNQQLNQKIDTVADDAKAGTAAALAAAGLAQAYTPGKNMVSVAGSTYRGKQGYAVGFSTITDNGNWIFKGTATGHSEGHFGATIGAGYQW